MEQFYYVVSCIFFGVFGLCFGSFLNVVIYRLPLGMNLAKPASHCTVCNHKLAWYDNIPLLSYLMLGGKCRYCRAPISPRYFLVELFNCVMWLLCAFTWAKSNLPFAIVCAAAISVLICIALCDSDTLYIPDSLQIALAVVAVAGIFFDPVAPWTEKIYGAALGCGMMLFFYLLGYLLFGREGLGIGDIKLAAVCGLLLGWKNIIVAFVLCIVAAVVNVIIRKIVLNKYLCDLPLSESGEFAFGPFIAWGAVCAMFVGNTLFDAYISLLA